MGKSYFLMKIGQKKRVLFSRSDQKVWVGELKVDRYGYSKQTKQILWPSRFTCLLEFSVHYLCYDVTDYQNHVMKSLIIKI